MSRITHRLATSTHRLSAGAAPIDGNLEMRSAAVAGCRQLLRRQLQTGAHWINCPVAFASACIEAGLGS